MTHTRTLCSSSPQTGLAVVCSAAAVGWSAATRPDPTTSNASLGFDNDRRVWPAFRRPASDMAITAQHPQPQAPQLPWAKPLESENHVSLPPVVRMGNRFSSPSLHATGHRGWTRLFHRRNRRQPFKRFCPTLRSISSDRNATASSKRLEATAPGFEPLVLCRSWYL